MSYFNDDRISHEIIRFALKEIETHGVSGMSVRRICLNAKVGKTTFYNKFVDKENLLINLNRYLTFRIKEVLFVDWNSDDSFDKVWFNLASLTWSLCLNFRTTVIAGQYIKEHFHQRDQELDLVELSPWVESLKNEKENLIELPVAVLNRMTLGVVISIAVDIAKGYSEDISETQRYLLFNRILEQIKK